MASGYCKHHRYLRSSPGASRLTGQECPVTKAKLAFDTACLPACVGAARGRIHLKVDRRAS